jgi:hypothetical protein
MYCAQSYSQVLPPQASGPGQRTICQVEPAAQAKQQQQQQRQKQQQQQQQQQRWR